MKIIKMLLVTACVLLVCSCSKDEPTPEQKAEPFKKMIVEKGEATYKLVNTEYYNKSERTNNEWEYQDLKYIAGYEIRVPSVLHIKNGRTWAPYQMFKGTGPSPLMTPWLLYCKHTGQNSTVFISTPIELSEDNTHVTIAGRDCEILSSSANGFVIQYESPFLYGDSDTHEWKQGMNRNIYTYQKIETQSINFDDYLCFDTEREMAIQLVALMREFFGDEFNLNDYTYGQAIYDDPIVNFDFILERVLKTLPE